MFEAFVIVFREAGELTLLTFAALAWAQRTGQLGILRWIVGGLLSGLVIAAALVATLPPWGMNEGFDIALTFGFGLSLLVVSTGTMASLGGIGSHATRVLGSWVAVRGAKPTAMFFMALSAAREALEGYLLLRFVAARELAEDVAWGTVLGFAACALIGWVWRKYQGDRSARWTFRLSAVVLFVIGAQMMAEALAEILVRGMVGTRMAQVGYGLLPYLEEGSRHWLSSLVLALIPLLLWARAWWRRTG